MFCPYCHHKLIEGEKTNYCMFEGVEVAKSKSLKADPGTHPDSLVTMPLSPEHMEQVVPSASKEPRKGALSKILLAVVGLVLVGVGAWYFLTYLASPTITDKLAPKESLTFTTIRVDEKDPTVAPLIKLLKLFPKYETILKDQRESLLRTLRLEPLNYDSDIAPWLGREVGLATLHQKSSSSGLNTVSISYVEIKGRKLNEAKNALDKLAVKRKEKNYTEDTEIYRNVTLRTFKEKSLNYPPYYDYPGSTLRSPRPTVDTEREIDSYTIYKNFVIRADNKEGLKTALDAIADRRVIASDKNYQQVRKQLGSNFVFTFINYPKLREIEDNSTALFLATIPQFNFIEGGGYALSAARNGIAINGYTFADKSRLPAGQSLAIGELRPQKIIQQVPLETFAYYESSNLKALFDSYKNSNDTKVREGYNVAVKGINSELGIDVEKDILSWMTEEYALAMYPSNASLAGGVIFNLKDKNAAVAGMTKLENAIVRSGGNLDSRAFSARTEPIIAGLKQTNFGPLNQLSSLLSVSRNPSATPTPTPTPVTPPVVTVGEEDYRGEKIRKIKMEGYYFPIEFSYSFVGDQLIMTYGTQGIKGFIDRGKNNAPVLSEKESFKKIISVLPQSNNGLFFLDLREAFDALSLIGLGDEVKETATDLRPLKAVAVTTTNTEAELFTKGFVLIENF